MIRVCPERDGACPHGIDCPFVIDRYHCKPEGPLPPHDGEVGALIAELLLVGDADDIHGIKGPAEKKRRIADALTSLSQRLTVAQATRRWNVDANGENLQVCRDLHDKEGECEWETFVPMSRLAVVEAERDEAREYLLAVVGKYQEEDVRVYSEMTALEAQLAHARKAAIEECAKVADEHAETWGAAMASPAIVIATALRALGGGK